MPHKSDMPYINLLIHAYCDTSRPLGLVILLLHSFTTFVHPEGVGLETNGAYIPRGHVELPTTRGFFFFESDGKGVCQDHAKKSVFLG